MKTYYMVHITETGKSFFSREDYRVFNKVEEAFKTIEEARQFIKERYTASQLKHRVKMYSDPNGKHIGYIYGFKNADLSHYPVDKWLQQDWVTITANTSGYTF